MLEHLNKNSNYLASSNSLIWVDCEHFGDEVSPWPCEEKLAFGVVWMINFFVEFLISCSLKREDPRQWNKQQYSQSPNICIFSSILFPLNDLRSHVAWCPTKYLNFFRSLNASTKSKIYEFGTEIFIKNNIFKLDIALSNILRMHILQSFDQLLEYFFTVFFRNFGVGLQLEIGSQRSPWQVFHDDVEMIVRFHHIINLNNIGVTQ